MRHLPHTPDDIRRMLDEMGVGDVAELFDSIPEPLRFKGGLGLPAALSEAELDAHMEELSRRNAGAAEYANFLGGGAYRHYIPAVVPALAMRSEYATAYTPYQPEAGQGTLQTIFEFQTLICQLTGMETANASMYDGAQALAESALMALRLRRKRRKLLAAQSIHPEYRRVMETYLSSLDVALEDIPFDERSGRVDFSALETALDEETAGCIVQSPNLFGVVEDLPLVARACESGDVPLVAAIAEPLSLALLKPPGMCGASIVCGEAQSFGVPISFGGPGAGFMATKNEYVRNMPGRLCGETVDAEGNRGYCLTLAAREQHIRREKATSNICTNQALMALMATIYLSLMGKTGLIKLARLNLARAEYAKKAIAERAAIRFAGPTFNEFVVRVGNAEKTLQRLKSGKILGGLPLGKWHPDLEECLLISVTELNSREDIDRLAALI